MLKKIGVKSQITSEIQEIKSAEKLLLPGVGAFDNGMTNLKEMGLLEVLNYKVLEEKVPILGICLGMQLMTFSSEEGVLEGLGWIKGRTIKFQFQDNSFKVPHMGWNIVTPAKNSKLFKGMEHQENRFYFVHSYYVRVEDDSVIVSKTEYGGIEFVSSFEYGNIFGVQFHPEKSHKFGMQILKNFSEV